MADKITRRKFIRDSAVTAGVLSTGLAGASIVRAGQASKIDTSKILNYNSNMEYRRCGRTGMMISAVALGGHWKRVSTVTGHKAIPPVSMAVISDRVMVFK